MSAQMFLPSTTTAPESREQSHRGTMEIAVEMPPQAQATAGANPGNKKDKLREKHNSILVVAALIATVTFTAALSPPGGTWQDSEPIFTDENASSPVPGKSIADTESHFRFKLFFFSNMCGFITSLSIILFIVSGLPISNRLTTCILVVMIYIAVSCMALAFVFGANIVIFSDDIRKWLLYVIFIWVGLVLFLLCSHLLLIVFRFLGWLCKKHYARL